MSKKVVYFFISVLLCLLTITNISGNINAVKASEQNYFNDFSSQSYMLIDNNSGEILFSNNENQKMPVASICKLMTALITIENIEAGNLALTDKLVASSYACEAEGSQAFLDAGSEYAVSDLLKSVIVASANDSSIVLAEAIGGSEANFVKLMNKRAKELSMTNTLYENSTGLPSANQYSTAKDCALILKEISKHNLYKENCQIWMDKLIHPSGRETELVNTNRLIRYYDSCVTGKTGFTDEAGYCLVSTSEKNGMNLTAVTLKCKDASSRFKESIELFEYGFNNFENKKVVSADQSLSFDLPVNKGKQEKVNLIAEKDLFTIIKKGDDDQVELKYELIESINAPVNAGEIVGKIIALKNGVVCGETNIICLNDIEKQNFADIFVKIINRWEI